jgi:sulfotransferase family protein
MTNPYVFIVGCQRSGTTLLGRLVDAHPQIAIIHESRWIPDWFLERRGLTSEGLVTSESINHLLDDPRFDRMRIGREQVLAFIANTQSMPYSSFIRGMFDLYGEARAKTLVGDKTPRYVRYMHILHALWPDARFVHLIRDGRDVCLSVAQWRKTIKKGPATLSTWQSDQVSTIALWWESAVQRGREAGSRLGPEMYYEIRYEAIIDNPERECAALCTFLGLPYHGAMLRFHEGRTITKPGLDAKKAWLPITPGLRDWGTQMAAEDVERFEAAAGQFLDELGYSRAVPNPRPESLEHASRIREQLSRDPEWIEYSQVLAELEAQKIVA